MQPKPIKTKNTYLYSYILQKNEKITNFARIYRDANAMYVCIVSRYIAQQL